MANHVLAKHLTLILLNMIIYLTEIFVAVGIKFQYFPCIMLVGFWTHTNFLKMGTGSTVFGDKSG
jgi:hypothetical protein